MNSNDLVNRGFGTWQSFSLATQGALLRGLPESFGVYSMRLPRPEQILQGSSDIAYIGKATNRNGVRGRIRQYFHPGWNQSTNLEMKDRLIARVELEIAFITTPDASSAAELESQLLLLFEAQHAQKPRYNKQSALAYPWKSQAGNAG